MLVKKKFWTGLENSNILRTENKMPMMEMALPALGFARCSRRQKPIRGAWNTDYANAEFK
jgi:hypothetical protein